MKHFPTTPRRIVAIAATAVAGLAISTAAYAATSSATANTADTASITAAAAPQCTAFDLGVWVAVGQPNGAAGTIYYRLEFTNLGARACSLFGFPGVSAIDHDGQQLGSPANWIRTASSQTVVLAPGATAHTVLAYHDAAVSTEPGCDPVSSAPVLRVYPPDQYSATFAAFGFEACSHPGVFYMSIVGPIVPGVGTING
jgi:hypothetical protein